MRPFLMEKKSNATISYIHYYFAHHGLQETKLYLNMDMIAQKNRYRTHRDIGFAREI